MDSDSEGEEDLFGPGRAEEGESPRDRPDDEAEAGVDALVDQAEQLRLVDVETAVRPLLGFEESQSPFTRFNAARRN